MYGIRGLIHSLLPGCFWVPVVLLLLYQTMLILVGTGSPTITLSTGTGRDFISQLRPNRVPAESAFSHGESASDLLMELWNLGIRGSG